MNQRMIEFYLDLAKRTAQLSRAKKLQVGCVLVTTEDALLYGWNGMPAAGRGGWLNQCEYELEDGSLKTYDHVLHAESNALMKLAKSTLSGIGSSLFCTHSPCIHCAKLIYQAGIVSVHYIEDYRCDHGVEFLKQCEVEVIKHNS